MTYNKHGFGNLVGRAPDRQREILDALAVMGEANANVIAISKAIGQDAGILAVD